MLQKVGKAHQCLLCLEKYIYCIYKGQILESDLKLIAIRKWSLKT